jgi:hypothetical protein
VPIFPTMKNGKIELSFEERILTVEYLEYAVVDRSDLKKIYAYGNLKVAGKKYCILFSVLGHYDVTEEALLSNNTVQ